MAAQILTLNGVDEYINTPEFTLTGDFELSFTFNTSKTSADYALYETPFINTLGATRIYVDNPDGLEILIGQGASFTRHIFGGQTLISNGEDNTLKITRVSSIIEAFLNETKLDADLVTSQTLQFSADLFGGGSAGFFEGTVIEASVVDEGVLTRRYDFNDGFSNTPIITNTAEPLGEDLNTVAGGWFLPRSSDSTITTQSPDLATSTVDTVVGTFGVAKAVSGFEVGEDYLISGTVQKQYTVGQLFHRLTVGMTLPNEGNERDLLRQYAPTDVVDRSYIRDALATTQYYGIIGTNPASTGDSVQIQEPSIRKATGYGFTVNVGSGGWSEVPSASHRNTDALEFFIEQTGTSARQFNDAAIAYYKVVTDIQSSEFNDLLRAAQQSVGFVGLWPGDRGN